MAIARQLMDPRNAAEVEDAMRYTPTLTPHIPDVVIVGVGIWRYCIRHHSWYHASARAAATLCHETRTSQPSPSPLQHATPNSLLILIDEDSGGDRHSCVAADVFRVS